MFCCILIIKLYISDIQIRPMYGFLHAATHCRGKIAAAVQSEKKTNRYPAADSDSKINRKNRTAALQILYIYLSYPHRQTDDGMIYFQRSLKTAL